MYTIRYMWQSVQETILTGWLIVVLLFGGEATLPPVPADTGTDMDAVRETDSATRATATVARVIDGDTIVLETGERVRLLGIDTPERDECYFAEAREYVAWWLDRATVILEADGRDKDEYGRLLRYVFTNRQWGGSASTTEFFVNDVLVQEGYARTMPIGEARRYRSQLYASEEAARAAGAGRWDACS